jgi:alcohol dehydrogenase
MAHEGTTVMKAARLHKPGSPLVIEDIAEPTTHAGGVKVRVLAAPVPSYASRVLGGLLPVPLPVPYTPGPSCVGEVEEIADDVVGVQPGEMVLCSAYHHVTPPGKDPEAILIGWIPLTVGSGPLLRYWKDGAYAAKAVYPAACVTRLGTRADGRFSPIEWSKLGALSIAYGGLLRTGLQPGQSVLVNGATGHLGSAAILVALAMGASRIVGLGRNRDALDQLAAIDPRIVAIEHAADHAPLKAHVGTAGKVDVALDALGYVPDPAATLASLTALRTRGTLVFLGGVLADIPISYMQMLINQWEIKGAFMAPPSAAAQLRDMAFVGTLRLDKMSVVEKKLDQVNEAIALAATQHGLEGCALVP